MKTKSMGIVAFVLVLGLSAWAAVQTSDNKAVDPVCGRMPAAEGARWTYDYQGTTYAFCSEACKTAFVKEPEKFLAQMKKMQAAAAECPMTVGHASAAKEGESAAFGFPMPGKPARPMSLPESSGQFLLFLVSAVCSLGVVVSFSMLIYISTFYTLSSTGVRIIAAVLADFLAGAIIPLPFFPQPFRAIAEMLPFAAMQNMPLRIYSGNIAGSNAFWGIALQVFWLTALIFTGRFMMKNALRKVVVQGG